MKKRSNLHAYQGKRAMINKLRILGTLAVLATAGFVFTTGTYAQTNGMEQREERSTARWEARAAKPACKAGGLNSRFDCRQERQELRQNGRQDQPAVSDQTPPAAR
jgi:hypothetical protein